MADLRDPATIAEELSDLRRYIKGLPKHLLDTGAFVAYQKRETLLHEELIAAQLYRVVGDPEQSPEPFSGLKEQMAAIVQRLSDFQEGLRRRTKIGTELARALPVLAASASLGAAFFVVQAADNGALFFCGAAILLTLLNSLLGSREQLAEHRHLSRELEAMKWQLEEYVKVDDSDVSDGMVKRELLLAMIKELAATKAEQLTKP